MMCCSLYRCCNVDLATVLHLQPVTKFNDRIRYAISPAKENNTVLFVSQRQLRAFRLTDIGCTSAS
jgi:hypothetical protein